MYNKTPIYMHAGLFKSQGSIQSFLKYYAHHDFLEPPTIGKYGRSRLDSDELKMNNALKIKTLSLKGQLQVSSANKHNYYPEIMSHTNFCIPVIKSQILHVFFGTRMP